VWRSTDRGATFRRTGFPDALKQVWCFMVDSRDPKRIFAGASPIDVYRSDDGGANWRKLATPKVGEHCKGPFASRVMRFAQNPKKPDEIYAALEINGVMRSTGRRRDLAGLQRRADQALRATASQEQDRERHHGRRHARRPCRDHQRGRSGRRDRGAAHGPVPHRRRRQELAGHGGRPLLAHTYGRDVKASPTEPNTLYAAFERRRRQSRRRSLPQRDGGQSWQRFDKVQVHGTIMSIGLHQSDPKQVYIGARYDGEVFGTQDAGKTWQAMPLPGEVQHIYSWPAAEGWAMSPR